MNVDRQSTQSSRRLTVPEFDRHAPLYDELLQDPLRNLFTGEQSHFFHLRKRDLLLKYFRDRHINTKRLDYLDVGCGQGELLTLLHKDFNRCVGCDPSPEMLSELRGIETRVQDHGDTLPFESATFDFITAVCVFHHVPRSARFELMGEIRRVLKPGGVFAIIEHNPYNPITRTIVNRTPVDANAVLLKPAEVKQLVRSAGLNVSASKYFLYFPLNLYRTLGRFEEWLSEIPLGGQYAIFGTCRD